MEEERKDSNNNIKKWITQGASRISGFHLFVKCYEFSVVIIATLVVLCGAVLCFTASPPRSSMPTAESKISTQQKQESLTTENRRKK